jgi:hypothetical protein
MRIMANRMYTLLLKNFFIKFMNYIRYDYLPLKRQGDRVKIRKKSWLKQLRVAISTRANMPSVLSPQNS